MITADSPVDDLGLSARASNVLLNRGWPGVVAPVRTVGDLLAMSEAELLGCRGMGRKSLAEIRAAVVRAGFTPYQDTCPHCKQRLPRRLRRPGA